MARLTPRPTYDAPEALGVQGQSPCRGNWGYPPSHSIPLRSYAVGREGERQRSWRRGWVRSDEE